MFLPASSLLSLSRGAGLVTLMMALGACATTQQPVATQQQRYVDPMYVSMYGALPNERFPMPAIDVSGVDPQFLRQRVSYYTTERPGTIVVDTQARFLYLVQEGGMAMRYGIGVGKQGLELEGAATIQRKAEWPRWTPTKDMIEREPERNGPWANGMEPGLTNPLGPRALYLYRDGRDTLFRIHGTSEPWSIGQAVSSGCIRLFNQDIVDLYSRIVIGTKVVVLQNGSPGQGQGYTI